MTIQYVMIAHNHVLNKHVRWAVLGSPDPNALQSGFNPADLDLPATVDYSITVPINGSGGVPPAGLAGGDLGGTYPNPSIAKLQGNTVSAASPSTNQVLTWNGSAWVPAVSGTTEAVGGDLSGNLPNPSVVKIQGTAVSGTAPTEGEALVAVGGTYKPTGFFFNVKNYGAMGDGSTDDRAAFVSAAAAVGSHGTLYLPTGTYRIASNLTLANALRIKFEEGAIIKPDNGVMVSLTAVEARGAQQIFDVSVGGSIQLVPPVYGATTAAGLPNTNMLYVTWFGAKGDSTTDDTLAFQGAVNAAGPGTTIFIPNTTFPYIISSTIRAYKDANGRYDGLHFLGEGGTPKGDAVCSTIWWDGNTISGRNATTTHKFSGAAHGVLIDGVSNMTSANVGDMIEFWGALNSGNNGRFVILQVNSPTQIVISNFNGVQGESGISWLLEQNMFDVRGTELRYTNLSFQEAPSKRVTAHINWTDSNITASFATGLVVDKCAFNDASNFVVHTTTIASASNGQSLPQSTINVASTVGFATQGVLLVTTSAGVQSITYTGTSGGNQFTGCTGGVGTMSTGGTVTIGLVAHARWGIKIGSLNVPLPGNSFRVVDSDGYSEVISPSNLENSHIIDCSFAFLEMASVIIDNINGNSYLHTMTKCGFAIQPLGFQISSPAAGQFNFYECNSSLIYDAVFQFGASSQKPLISGGHHEILGTLVRDEGSGASAGFSIRGVTSFVDLADGYGNTYYFTPYTGSPMEFIPNGLNPAGVLMSSVGSNITVADCWFDVVPQDFFIEAGISGNAESNLIVDNCTFFGQSFAAGIDPNAGIRPFASETSRPGPYKLRDGDTLIFTVTSGLTNTTTSPQTVTFSAADTPDIGRCWGYNVAYMFHKDPNSTGVVPYALGDSSGIIFIKTGQPYTNDQINWLGTTTIASGSNGQSLPQATIHVADATHFSSNGTLVISTSAGLQTVYYTGTSGGNTFTGCTGGTGMMSTGGSVANALLHELGLDAPNNEFVQDVKPSAAHVASSGFAEVFAGQNMHLTMRNNVATLDQVNFTPVNDVDMHFGSPIAIRSVEQRNTSTGPSLNGLTCANLGGTVTFTNNQIQALVVFDNVEPDANYQILVKDNVTNGAVADGATNAHPSVLTTRGFLLTLDQAPGAGTSVSHSWQIQRAPTTSSVDPVDPTIITAAPLTWWIDPMWNHIPQSTTITSGSNGLSLPQSTINVVASWTNPSNTILVTTSNGPQLVTYTGSSGTSFTGCTGGTGVMATGNAVVAADGSLATIVDRSSSAANLTGHQISTTWPLWVTSPTLSSYVNGQSGPNNFPFFRFFSCNASNGSSTQQVITGSAWYMFVLYRAVFPPNFPYFGFPNSAGGEVLIVNVNGAGYGSYNLRSGQATSNRQITYVGFTDWIDAGTYVVSPSVGQALPQSTIHVNSTIGFPSTGTIFVVTSAGSQTVTYSGVTSNTFTGCAGGKGTMRANDSVSVIDGNTNWELAEIYTTTGATTPTLKINGVVDPFVSPPSLVWPGPSNGIHLCQANAGCDIGLVLVYNGDITSDPQLANLRTAIRNKYKVY